MEDRFSTVSVIGLGYIGLPTAAMFASRQIRVIGVDVNAETIDTINDGRVHIVEPDLDIVVRSAVQQGFLSASLTPEPADAFLIAVPTPFKNSGHEPDLSYIEQACAAIAGVLQPGNLVVLESTSPVGATEQVASWLAAARPDLTFPQDAGEASDIRIAHCPERVLPGKVMQELIHNDRVVGGMTPACSKLAVSLYRLFVQGKCVVTNARTAEMAKLTENSFRDVNIALANELSIICDTLDIDVWELIGLANRHPRVDILQPGAGVGGHCIAVDPWFIVARSPDQARLIRTAREVNDSKPDWVIDKVRVAVSEYAEEQSAGMAEEISIACYGLAFKPNIDDLRESPALEIALKLEAAGLGDLLLVEPHIEALPEQFTAARLVDEQTARSEANIHVLLVDHAQFAKEPPSGFRLIDCRGFWR